VPKTMAMKLRHGSAVSVVCVFRETNINREIDAKVTYAHLHVTRKTVMTREMASSSHNMLSVVLGF